MPLYDYQCASGHKFERFLKLENYKDAQNCACGSTAERIIKPVMFTVENVSYTCPITGKHIGSKREHERNLDIHDCRVLETGEKELNEKRRLEVEAEFDRKVETTVEKEFEAMPSHKKEQLANELLKGADVSIERK